MHEKLEVLLLMFQSFSGSTEPHETSLGVPEGIQSDPSGSFSCSLGVPWDPFGTPENSPVKEVVSSSNPFGDPDNDYDEGMNPFAEEE